MALNVKMTQIEYEYFKNEADEVEETLYERASDKKITPDKYVRLLGKIYEWKQLARLRTEVSQ